MLFLSFFILYDYPIFLPKHLLATQNRRKPKLFLYFFLARIFQTFVLKYLCATSLCYCSSLSLALACCCCFEFVQLWTKQILTLSRWRFIIFLFSDLLVLTFSLLWLAFICYTKSLNNVLCFFLYPKFGQNWFCPSWASNPGYFTQNWPFNVFSLQIPLVYLFNTKLKINIILFFNPSITP